MAERGVRLAASERASRLLLLTFSILLSLLAGELLLRALGLYGERHGSLEKLRAVDDPVLDYRGIADATWISKGLLYATNHHGFRDFDYAYEKPPGTSRIVVAGDSVTHGHGVEMEAIYPKVLERLLAGGKDRAASYQVLMLSLGALNVEQGVHLLAAEGLRYDPDILVVGYVLNDAAEGTSRAHHLAKRARASPWSRVKALGRRSSLLFLSYRAAQRLKWRLMDRLGRTETASYIRRDPFSRLHASPEGRARLERSFERLDRIAGESGAKPCVVIFPLLHDLDSYRWLEVHRQVAEAARRWGIPVLDLLPFFRQYRARELQVASGDHVHPNALGHRLAGEALRDFLLARGWLADEADGSARSPTRPQPP